MNPHFSPWQYSSKVIFIKLKCPKYSFAMVTLDAFWFSVSSFGTHLALTLLKPIFFVLCKIWCANALLLPNWLATSCNVTLQSLLRKTSTFATIVRVTASTDFPGLGLFLTLVLPSLNCETRNYCLKKTYLTQFSLSWRTANRLSWICLYYRGNCLLNSISVHDHLIFMPFLFKSIF